jgi:hypothetical protein
MAVIFFFDMIDGTQMEFFIRFMGIGLCMMLQAPSMPK